MTRLATLLITMMIAASLDAAPRIDVHIDTAQAEAVLAIMKKESPVAEDWQKLYATEGYRRLKQREAQMKREFSDEEFRAFVSSPELRKRGPELEATLRQWAAADPAKAAERALRYLPDGATIKATIYPLIKPRENSFVFEIDSPDPAIMLYLDPSRSKEQFENTLAHELHHIGFGTACPPSDAEKEIESLPAERRFVARRIGALGEGFAMLAAAGSVDRHPHEFSAAADRERWDRDMKNVERDLETLDAFFRDVLDGTLSEDEASQKAFTFYGVQGPWYTVGWHMAATIEREFGRSALIDAMCDPRRLLNVYNGATARAGSKSVWSEQVVRAMMTVD